MKYLPGERHLHITGELRRYVNALSDASEQEGWGLDYEDLISVAMTFLMADIEAANTLELGNHFNPPGREVTAEEIQDFLGLTPDE